MLHFEHEPHADFTDHQDVRRPGGRERPGRDRPGGGRRGTRVADLVRADERPQEEKVKIEAKADKSKVKGRLDVVADSAAGEGRDATGALELIVVQKLVAGVWVDLSNGSCKPNGSFVLSLSFSVKASLTLRVYHPETTLYASATSSVFGVVVV
ncbi:hypothetical protein AB0N89_23075 [Amycolatopsis sp. NPDC089917]|uniref:hypothetical protein n=1 Tax=Amycolatopsis sp. NPDC089917 TaxID=3155187 RepID=UPI0034428FA9